MIEILIGILAVQQLLDIYTTKAALDTGRAREMNAVVLSAMRAIGVLPALVLIKAGFMGLVWYCQTDHWLYLVVLGWAVVFYSVVLRNNFRVLRKLRR